jgi:hypothetical protein
MLAVMNNLLFVFSLSKSRTRGSKANSSTFEPRDAHKAGAAAGILYFATRYYNNTEVSMSFLSANMENDLRAWLKLFPPDSLLQNRNNGIASFQLNRNPYIDSINYACHVSFSNMTYLDIDCNVGLEELLQSNFSVFPVPSNGKVYAQVNGTNITEYKVTDLLGRVVVKNKSVSLPVLEIDGQNLKSGKYLIEVTTEFGKTKGSFIIE